MNWRHRFCDSYSYWFLSEFMCHHRFTHSWQLYQCQLLIDSCTVQVQISIKLYSIKGFFGDVVLNPSTTFCCWSLRSCPVDESPIEPNFYDESATYVCIVNCKFLARCLCYRSLQNYATLGNWSTVCSSFCSPTFRVEDARQKKRPGSLLFLDLLYPTLNSYKVDGS